MNFFRSLLDWRAKRKAVRARKDLLCNIRCSIHLDDDILPDETRDRLNLLAEEVWALEPAADPRAAMKKISAASERFDRLAENKTFSHHMKSIFDVLLVALTVAFGIRTLFLQPFQIPTGSMQPTLFGVHYIDKAGAAPFTSKLTGFFRGLFAEKVTVNAGADGAVPYSPQLDNDVYRYLDTPLWPDSHVSPGKLVCDGWISTGDHLFVDRVSLHFNELKRGEVFIFTTEGLRDENRQPLNGFFYIKRIAGIGGDTLKIENGMLMIRPRGEQDFKPAPALSGRFERIYSGKGGYHGHLADGMLKDGREFTVPENSYFALGDNTSNSLDSRYWGAVPRRNVIGRALNIFWPVTRRWGLVDTLEPLDTPTGDIPVLPDGTPVKKNQQKPAMRLQ